MQKHRRRWRKRWLVWLGLLALATIAWLRGFFSSDLAYFSRPHFDLMLGNSNEGIAFVLQWWTRTLPRQPWLKSDCGFCTHADQISVTLPVLIYFGKLTAKALRDGVLIDWDANCSIYAFYGPTSVNGSHFAVVVPHFSLVFLSVLTIMLSGGRAKTNPSLCVKCGYDIRASRGRCSECGEPLTSPTPVWTPKRSSFLVSLLTPRSLAFAMAAFLFGSVSSLATFAEKGETLVWVATPGPGFGGTPYVSHPPLDLFSPAALFAKLISTPLNFDMLHLAKPGAAAYCIFAVVSIVDSLVWGILGDRVLASNEDKGT